MATDTATLIHSVEFVVIDADPVETWTPTTDDSGLTFPRVAAVWLYLPERFSAVFAELVERDPGDPALCCRCGDPVGYAEMPREDHYGREYDVTEWRFTALVAEPGDGPVSVQCEDCCPDVPAHGNGGDGR